MTSRFQFLHRVELSISDVVAKALRQHAVFHKRHADLTPAFEEKFEDLAFENRNRGAVIVVSVDPQGKPLEHFLCRFSELICLLYFTSQPSPELAQAILKAYPFAHQSCHYVRTLTRCFDAFRFHRSLPAPAVGTIPQWTEIHLDGYRYVENGSIWHFDCYNIDDRFARLVDIETFHIREVTPQHLDTLRIHSRSNSILTPPEGCLVQYPLGPNERTGILAEAGVDFSLIRNIKTGATTRISTRSIYHVGRIIQVPHANS